jgi:DNA-binding response OmpR family regulator
VGAGAAGATVLIIDDDECVRDTVHLLLEREGYSVISAADGRSGLNRAVTSRPDLAIVDLRLPGISGTEVCKGIRAMGRSTPVIVLSAVCSEVDKVLLLEIGADDYVVKPFGARELVARIRALLRRVQPQQPRVMEFGEVAVDLERRTVTRGGAEVELTPVEYRLLVFFLNNADRPLTRDLLLDSVWGAEAFPNHRTVDAHVMKLRHKLEPDPAVPRHFLTMHGVGYRFMP